MSDWTLVCPFLTDDPVYARGVEFGLLYAQMRQADEEGERIEGYYLLDNQEQITLAANRLGWRVQEMRKWDEHWFFLRLYREKGSHWISSASS